MRLDSVRDFKKGVSDAIIALDDTPGGISFYEATGRPMPKQVALGVARLKDGIDGFGLAIRTDSPELAERLRAQVSGEADVRIVTVAKRSTPGYFQGTRRPLEPGLQIAMESQNSVGTLGAFVRGGDGTLYALTNSHVAADEGRAEAGWPIGQPFGAPHQRFGVLAHFVPFSSTAPNVVDAALIRLDKTKAVLGYTLAAPDRPVDQARLVTPDDIGMIVTKAGRTTGVRPGRITSVEIDGLSVAYDRGILRFNDQIEISGGPETDFSAPGDSGSMVVDRSGYAVGLLFAGGKDSSGEDFTYANRMTDVLRLLGVDIARP